jgi:hypothetical protein
VHGLVSAIAADFETPLDIGVNRPQPRLEVPAVVRAEEQLCSRCQPRTYEGLRPATIASVSCSQLTRDHRRHLNTPGFVNDCSLANIVNVPLPEQIQPVEHP